MIKDLAWYNDEIRCEELQLSLARMDVAFYQQEMEQCQDVVSKIENELTKLKSDMEHLREQQ